MATKPTAPLSDAIIIAVAQLVDDAQGARRDPSHSDIEFNIRAAGLTTGDPNSNGQTLGKAKRVRSTISWAFDAAPEAGGQFVSALIASVKGY